jgi:uncharacterized protein YbjT (DUF2867 family)
MSELPILIIGGAGKTGARVNALLRASGTPTRPVSRSTPVPFDWTRPETWPAAFAGVSMAYVTYQPDLAVEGASDAIAEVGRLARENRLERVVLLSGRGEPGAQRAEAALQQSGVPWTIVRASWFNQNFSEGYLRDGVLAGEIALPAGAVPEPFIDADDIAEVAVAALTDQRHASKVYEVTGPRALTFAQAVAEIAAAVGRPVRYRQVAPEDFAAGMQPHAPTEVIELMLELFTVVLDGRNSDVAHGVEQALGRPARDFSDYARRTAATGVWRA